MKKRLVIMCLLALFATLPITGFKTARPMSLPKKEVVLPKVQTTDFVNVRVTYYNPVSSQCDENPLETASGAIIDTTRTTALRWCAISRNLHKRYGGKIRFGDVIELTGSNGKHKISGKYIVKDLMPARWKNKVDILIGEKDGFVSFDKVKLKHKPKKQKTYLVKNKHKDQQSQNI